VVFPGKEPIQEWLAGGYKLDARPSIPLILSIFDPNSPGHDGALIVAKGKFTQFGVRLPISQNSKLPNELGTRHHAAMGLTEKSDALAREVKVITTPIYLDSIYNDAKIFCKVIAPPAIQPANKQWPDVEVEIKVGY
jgi:hypothetical protein